MHDGTSDVIVISLDQNIIGILHYYLTQSCILSRHVLGMYTFPNVGNTYLGYKCVSSVRSGMATRYTS